MAVTASMANFAWQNMAFVGLSSPPILGPTQDLIGESGLPAPSETELGIPGEVKVDLKGDFMVGSLDGEIGGQGGVSLEIDHPTADVLDLLGQQKMRFGSLSGRRRNWTSPWVPTSCCPRYPGRSESGRWNRDDRHIHHGGAWPQWVPGQSARP